MASFDEVAKALECALATRDAFTSRNEAAHTILSIRVGLAAGEPVDRDGDLFGPTVNLASRLCAAAEPDSILVSDVVRELGSSSGFLFADAHQFELQGFAAPMSASELVGVAS